MPRVSDKRQMIQWYLESIGQDIERRQSLLLREFLDENVGDVLQHRLQHRWLEHGSPITLLDIIRQAGELPSFSQSGFSSSSSSSSSSSTSSAATSGGEDAMSLSSDTLLALKYQRLEELQRYRYLEPRNHIPKSLVSSQNTEASSPADSGALVALL